MKKWIFLSLISFFFLKETQAQYPIFDTSISLKEAIGIGLERHPNIHLAQNSVEQSKQVSRQNLAGYLPQVNVSSTLDYNYKLQENVIPAGIFGPEEQRIKFGSKFASTSVIQLDQTLYDQSMLVGIQASKPYEELKSLELDKAEEVVIYNIAQAYYTILVTQEQKKLLLANKTRFEELLRIINLQKEYGVVNQVDVDQVSVNLSNIASQLSILDNNIQLAYNQLKNAMGISQQSHVSLTDSSRILNEAATQQQLQLNQEFDFSKTITFKEKQLNSDLLDLNIKSIKYGILPKVSFYARYGANGFDNEKLFGAYDPLLDFGSMGLKVSWNLFSGFRRDATLKIAMLDKDKFLTNMEMSEELMKLQFNNSRNNLIRARSTIEINKQNVSLAQKVYDNTNLKYKEGIAPLMQLLNAEQSLREANNNYSQSLIDFFKADLELNKANGTLKQFFLNL